MGMDMVPENIAVTLPIRQETACLSCRPALFSIFLTTECIKPLGRN
jgi:hypothetical protein